jgi:hypothetical protein
MPLVLICNKCKKTTTKKTWTNEDFASPIYLCDECIPKYITWTSMPEGQNQEGKVLQEYIDLCQQYNFFALADKGFNEKRDELFKKYGVKMPDKATKRRLRLEMIFRFISAYNAFTFDNQIETDKLTEEVSFGKEKE